MKGDNVVLNQPMFVTAGDYVLTVSGTGGTVSEAKEACYKTIKNKIDIPNSISYRTDIGERLEDQIPLLQKHGFAKGLKYE
jgi:phosphoribosylamine--glycine ligase